MEHEFRQRGYLLPPGCKDLMDAPRYRENRPAPDAPAAVSDDDAAFDAAFAKALLESDAGERGLFRGGVTPRVLAEFLGLKLDRILHELMEGGVSTSADASLTAEQVTWLLRRCGFKG